MDQRITKAFMFLARRQAMRDDELDELRDLVCDHDLGMVYDDQGQLTLTCKHCGLVRYV